MVQPKVGVARYLAIDEPQTQALTYALNEQTENGNRDLLYLRLFVKLFCHHYIEYSLQ